MLKLVSEVVDLFGISELAWLLVSICRARTFAFGIEKERPFISKKRWETTKIKQLETKRFRIPFPAGLDHLWTFLSNQTLRTKAGFSCFRRKPASQQERSQVTSPFDTYPSRCTATDESETLCQSDSHWNLYLCSCQNWKKQREEGVGARQETERRRFRGQTRGNGIKWVLRVTLNPSFSLPILSFQRHL